ncbi:MAG: hydroxymethylglutaryl-CoA lyase [Phycisphaerales bacterium]
MMRTDPVSIHITDVGPRDGLQNEKQNVPAAAKIALVDALSAAGVREIEVSSFVSPRWVPQLADAAEVFAGITRREGVTYTALVPNMQGYEAAAAVGVRKIAVFTAASETFTQRNINATIAESVARFQPLIETAHADGVSVRGYVSCAVACPYEGPIAPASVRAVAMQLRDIGVDEIDLGETLGLAVPRDIEALLERVADVVLPADLVLHLHDTRGGALACCARAIDLGVRRFDTSCGGMGGCPYAPGAAGNLATEDLIYFCDRMGYATGINLDQVIDAARHIATAVGRPVSSRVGVAGGCAAAGEAACARDSGNESCGS